MNSRKKLIAIGFLLAVSTGYAVSNCCASLVLVAESSFSGFNQHDSISNNGKNTTPIPERPNRFVRTEHPTTMNNTMSGPTTISGSGGVCILIDYDDFDLLLTHSGLVFLRSWMWLPGPPIDDLLKVPISC